MPILPLPQRVLTVVGTGVRDSPPVQTMIKAAVVAAHEQNETLERWQVEISILVVYLVCFCLCAAVGAEVGGCTML